MTDFILCVTYVLLTLSYGIIQISSNAIADVDHFSVEYGWNYLNFTWPTLENYEKAIKSGSFVPQNLVPTGLKIYNDRLYLSMPKFRDGVPVTLAYIPMDTAKHENELLIPFPSWQMNDDSSCANFQSVQSMEIDTKGVMWVLDGLRTKNNVDCPPKLVLLDLNNNGSVIDSYVFPNEICLQNGGFLNDIVIDESDGGFAYITDTSTIDPGLIVYSRKSNHTWKIRDRSMFPELWAANFTIGNVTIENITPVDGIALSTKPQDESSNRTVYYTALTGIDIFGISTTILKDEAQCRSDSWRSKVQFIGKKQGQTDGMVVDSKGNLYYTLLPVYGVGKWNMDQEFNSSTVIDFNTETMIWPDGFAMDNNGYLYLISNHIFNFVNSNFTPELTADIKFRVLKLYTGTRNYLYNDL